MPLFAKIPTVRAVNIRKAAHQGGAIKRFELIEPRAVDQACDELVHVIGFARILRDDAVQFRRDQKGCRRR